MPALALLCVGWADSWDQLKTMAGTVTSVQAEFVQEKHLPILAKPLVSKGVFYYQAPRSLRWEYRWPVQSILAMHDNRVRETHEELDGTSQEWADPPEPDGHPGNGINCRCYADPDLTDLFAEAWGES